MDKEDVIKFLNDFKAKRSVFGIIYRDDRGKNLQALADLEITALQRTEFIEKLEVENYSSGPHKNTLYPKRPDYWEFGLKIKDKVVYIKVEMGLPNTQVICISFHAAEHDLKYPFK
ncbi:MAG: toxin [Ignavibacteriales bacterium]|nr:toxin [Ignavibacteriales bacterium]